MDYNKQYFTNLAHDLLLNSEFTKSDGIELGYKKLSILCEIGHSIHKHMHVIMNENLYERYGTDEVALKEKHDLLLTNIDMVERMIRWFEKADLMFYKGNEMYLFHN